jgi:hypothetical protein
MTSPRTSVFFAIPWLLSGVVACAEQVSVNGRRDGGADLPRVDGGGQAADGDGMPWGGSGSDAGASGFDSGLADKCGELVIPATVEVTSGEGNLLIVFDQSNSMTTRFSGEPLWQAASRAVRDAVAPHQQNLTVGAIFFPTEPVAGLACLPEGVADMGTPPQISFRDGPSFLTAWDARWSAANLVFSTPTQAAMQKGAAALDGAQLTGETVVLLVTDGASTCLGDTSADIAAAWHDRGIATYVIGLPGAGPAASELTSIAAAGGTQDFFTPADSAALTAELDHILNKIVKPSLSSCDIQFAETPERLDEIVLVVTELESGERFKVLPGPNGWQAHADNRGASLLGSTCEDAKAGRFSNVSFAFGCEDIPVF